MPNERGTTNPLQLQSPCDAGRRRMLRAGLGATAIFLPATYAWVWAQSEGTLKLLRAPKFALVIGNSNYKHSPLKNPSNDAQAIAAALKNTGFSVTVKLDAVQAEMSEAVYGFTQTLAKSKGVGLFYFAGHGLQLAWRNYMIPVDADIRSAADIQKQGVEVGTLLSGIGKASNPLNVIILDACRDNPFSNTGSADQKGLSQMDAPPSTLLAYATAPGNVASDGDGAHGLYTEHLLKEIVVPNAKVEDVFKRVRLHVRRRTSGQQIPWESTSLEEDFYFVPPKTLATLSQVEAERERKLEEAEHKRKQEQALLDAKHAADEAEHKRQQELATLEKRRLAEEAERNLKKELALKEAQRIAEAAERRRREEQALREAKLAEEEAERKYKQELALREKQYAAQEAERKRKEEHALRETKLAEEAERKSRQEPTAKPDANRAERQYAEESAIWEKIKASTEPEPLEGYLLRFPSGRFSELAQFQLDRVLARRGEKKIEVISDAKNPFTKGMVRTDTHYKIGDVFRYRETDTLTRMELRTYAMRVTAIGDNEVIFNNGNYVTDLLGNALKVERRQTQYTGSQFYIPEYSVGKRWSVQAQRKVADWPARYISYDFRVVAREQVVVEAGTFDAFKIEGHGWTRSNDDKVSINLQARYWMAPGVRRAVVFENVNRNSFGRTVTSERQELISYTQG
jgi:uncharacterized caspase-like protein